MRWTLPLPSGIWPQKIKIYMYPSVVRPILPLLCRKYTLKVKVYMYHFVKRVHKGLDFQRAHSGKKAVFGLITKGYT